MGMIVKNNLPGTKALNQLNKNNKAVGKDLKKVATGMKINTAEDDASAFAVSEKMQAQLRAIDQDVQNTQNGSTMLKTAEGAIENTVDVLRTLKEKVLNAANDTNTDWDRTTIQKELDQALEQIDDNSRVTLLRISMMPIGSSTTATSPSRRLSIRLISVSPCVRRSSTSSISCRNQSAE